jgi:hypothetical protein
MIIYGSRSTTLKAAELPDEKCSNCQTQGSIIMGVYSKYAHIFWIPIFPIGKVGISQCLHCKQVLKENQMPTELKKQYWSLKNQAKVPIWQFIGLILIGVLVVGSIISGNASKKNEAQYLAAPQSGDIYEFKTEDGSYSTWKLTKVTMDSLGISFNKFAISKITGLYKIEKPENYPDTTVWISKTTVSKMYSDGKISGIERSGK